MSFVRPNVKPDPPLPASLVASTAPAVGLGVEGRMASGGRPVLSGALQTEYIASLLQRHAPMASVAPPSEQLSAYQTRDLLQSRSNYLSKLRGDRGSAEGGLAVAHSVVQWQLRARDASKAPGGGGGGKDDEGGGAPLPTIAEVAAQYGGTSGRTAAAIAAQSLSAALKDSAWQAFRASQRAAAAAEIQGRRRPQTAYYERPAAYANNVHGQLSTLQQRLNRQGARGGAGLGAVEHGESGSGEGAAAGGSSGGSGGGGAAGSPGREHGASPLGAAGAGAQQPPAAFAALLADPHAFVGAPHRVALPKRITQPVVLRPGTAPAGAGGGGPKAGAARAGVVARRAPLAEWWAAPAETGGGGGPPPAIPPSNAVTYHDSPAAVVLAAAGRLLSRFQRDSEEDAARAVTAAARLGVPVADGGEGGAGTGRGAGAGGKAMKLPPLSELSHALRPATAAGGRRGGGEARPPSAKAPPPPPPKPAEEGVEEPPPLPLQFIGGMYTMHPLDAEAQREDFRQRILRDLQKAAKAAAAAARQ